jgi:hypothetical protein
MQRRRKSVPHTFESNIAAERKRLEAEAARLKPGPKLDTILAKISQLDTAIHINEWISSPGLQPPQALKNLGK